ncbi:hypothetical protein [Consotaella aegiceratis]|uniref:hypothetical protein n=1 Tax=Consotaella aegiceratis TaxID=3097961 RepID=UPI002F425730
MPVFRCHLAPRDGEPQPPCIVTAPTPQAARQEAAKRHPGEAIRKVKLDRESKS